jgi:hypothetical protein
MAASFEGGGLKTREDIKEGVRMSLNCLKCGQQLPEIEGPGRPRKFCSEVCRKAAAMEIRRLDARIAKLEKDESTYRIKGAETWAKRAAEEIRRLEARLAELVAPQVDDAGVCIDSD